MRPSTILGAEPAAAADLHCLVDADNFFQDATSVEVARHQLMELMRACQSRLPEFSTVRVRLYGGWLEGGSLTQRASQIAQTMAAAFPLPMPLPDRTIVRGSWDLALALLDAPELRFEDTFRRRAAVPRLRLAKSPLPDGCISDPERCPAHVLKRITKDPLRVCGVDGCVVTSASMFLTAEQKQVDTMMTIDMLHAASLDRSSTVCVSDDTDFVPGLVAASRVSRRVAYCNLRHSYDDSVQQTLMDLGITRLHISKAEL